MELNPNPKWKYRGSAKHKLQHIRWKEFGNPLFRSKNANTNEKPKVENIAAFCRFSTGVQGPTGACVRRVASFVVSVGPGGASGMAGGSY